MKKVITVLVAVVIICGVFAGGMMVNQKVHENDIAIVNSIHDKIYKDDALIHYMNDEAVMHDYGYVVDRIAYEIEYDEDTKQIWIDYSGYMNGNCVAGGLVTWDLLESKLV